MNVIVTGAAGFVGRHVVAALLARGHHVTAVDRDEKSIQRMPWFKQCRFVVCDIYHPIGNLREIFGDAEAVVHLAWPGLPNYKALFHYEINLPSDYFFLKSLVKNGYCHLLIAGTCFEYGLVNGCLSENIQTQPAIPYALAKDTLRKFLIHLRSEITFNLQWARLFYVYGEGQNPKSLLSQLNQAIDRKDTSFDISDGEQLRDFLPITEAAIRLVTILEHPDFVGTVNICSGNPISVRKFVESHIAERQSDIQLNLGRFPYPDYEPMAFWGDSSRYNSLGTKS